MHTLKRIFMSSKLDQNTNAINWFEIPVTDMPRAKKFYEAIFDIIMKPMEMMGMKMAMFPGDGSAGKVSGALVQSSLHQPGATGSVLYLNGNPDLDIVLMKVSKAGGEIAMPKTIIDKNTGYMAFIIDTEGNKIGIHSTK